MYYKKLSELKENRGGKLIEGLAYKIAKAMLNRWGYYQCIHDGKLTQILKD
jgi:hypothetical protein